MAGSLSDLKDKWIREKVQITIISFNGLSIETDIGSIGMDQDGLYLGRDRITEKEILALVKKKNEDDKSGT